MTPGTRVAHVHMVPSGLHRKPPPPNPTPKTVVRPTVYGIDAVFDNGQRGFDVSCGRTRAKLRGVDVVIQDYRSTHQSSYNTK